MTSPGTESSCPPPPPPPPKSLNDSNIQRCQAGSLRHRSLEDPSYPGPCPERPRISTGDVDKNKVAVMPRAVRLGQTAEGAFPTGTLSTRSSTHRVYKTCSPPGYGRRKARPPEATESLSTLHKSFPSARLPLVGHMAHHHQVWRPSVAPSSTFPPLTPHSRSLARDPASGPAAPGSFRDPFSHPTNTSSPAQPFTSSSPSHPPPRSSSEGGGGVGNPQTPGGLSHPRPPRHIQGPGRTALRIRCWRRWAPALPARRAGGKNTVRSPPAGLTAQ